MAKTMKAAVVRAFGRPLAIEEVPLPTPGPGEVLVKIMASGVCHTDLHAADGDWPVKPALPFIPGHEGAGIVSALGAGVTGLKEGDPVGIAWLHDACGSCEYCITGWETLCTAQHNSGYSVNGTFAEYAIGSAAYVGRLPDRPDFAALAPILCAGVTTYKGIKETDVRPGEWIVISGVGGLGHVAVQYAKAMGLHVVAVDVTDEKLALARSLGADIAVNGRTPGRGGGRVEGDRWRRARRAGHRRVGPSLRSGVADGTPQGNREPRRTAAGRVPDAHFRRRAQANHDPWLDRGHSAGSDRGARIRRRRQGQRAHPARGPGGCEQRVRGVEGWGSRRQDGARHESAIAGDARRASFRVSAVSSDGGIVLAAVEIPETTASASGSRHDSLADAEQVHELP